MSSDTYSPSAQDVKALRERTGAGMMDCKKALVESGGDVDQAIEILRKKQGKRIEDRGERVASEGTIQTYIHSNAKVGVLVEVNCETDFVARNDDFVAFARDIALHIAAANPLYVTEDEVDPAEAREQARPRSSRSRPPTSPRTSGRRSSRASCKKWLDEVVLLNQEHVNDGQVRGQDDQAAPGRDRREDRRERRHPPLRPLRRRPVAAARAGRSSGSC